MSRRPIPDEQHLQGAFWASIGYLLAEHRSGRRDLHVGSWNRVELAPSIAALPDGRTDVFDLVAAREQLATLTQLLARLDPLERKALRSLDTSIEELLTPLSGATLLGPDGRPAGAAHEQNITVSVEQVTAELMARLAREPQLLHALHPRRFEEVVAELFAQQGYEVTLTAASKDGGADLYVFDRRGVGSFLYLVECKKYRVDRPVGVGIVRQLFGVVQALNATAGIVATTSHFTRGAATFAGEFQYKLSLHDFAALKEWLRKSAV